MSGPCKRSFLVFLVNTVRRAESQPPAPLAERVLRHTQQPDVDVNVLIQRFIGSSTKTPKHGNSHLKTCFFNLN